MSSLSRLEQALVGFVLASTAHTFESAAARDELLAAGFAPWACDAIALAPMWPWTDDDRLDVIVLVAARSVRDGAPMSEAEIASLRGVGMSDANLLDLAHLIKRCATRVV